MVRRVHCVVGIVLGKCVVVPAMSARIHRCRRNDRDRQGNGDEQTHEDVGDPHVRALWAGRARPSIEDAIALLVDDLASLHQSEVGGLIL